MSQDIIADTLNEIMNAKRAGKSSIITKKHSKVLIGVMKIAKENNYILDYKIDGTKMEITAGELNECRAIKPRFNVTLGSYDKYMRRFLPARNMGIIIVSTNKGLMTHIEAIEKNLGGALIAYFY